MNLYQVNKKFPIGISVRPKMDCGPHNRNLIVKRIEITKDNIFVVTNSGHELYSELRFLPSWLKVLK